MSTVTIDAPASKSISHRALICASLAHGKSELHNVLQSLDITITRRALKAAGATINEQDGVLNVCGFEQGPLGADKDSEPVNLFMAESGTSCRLLTGVLAAGKGRFRISGATRLHERPIGNLTNALANQGVKFQFEINPGYPPFIMDTNGLKGGLISISLKESSQYLSGLLLAAPLAKIPVTITITGEKAVSWPYVALTLSAMNDFKIDFDVAVKKEGQWGVVPWQSLKSVTPGKVRFIIRPSVYEPSRYRVESDWSGGSYFLAAGAVGKVAVRVNGLRPDSLQGDRAMLQILQNMGANVEVDNNGVTVHPSKLTGINVNMSDCPDLVPTVAVVAAFADSPTTITDVDHLRIKECDRLAAMISEVARAGASTEELDDGLRITPKPLAKGETVRFQTYDDHRIAMSTAIFSLAGIKVKHDNTSCVSKSFPTFFEEWEKVFKGQQ